MKSPEYYADPFPADPDEVYTDEDIVSAYLSEVDRTGLSYGLRDVLAASLDVSLARVHAGARQGHGTMSWDPASASWHVASVKVKRLKWGVR